MRELIFWLTIPLQLFPARRERLEGEAAIRHAAEIYARDCEAPELRKAA